MASGPQIQCRPLLDPQLQPSPCGNPHLAAAVAGLLGSEAGSDCLVQFCVNAPFGGANQQGAAASTSSLHPRRISFSSCDEEPPPPSALRARAAASAAAGAAGDERWSFINDYDEQEPQVAPGPLIWSCRGLPLPAHGFVLRLASRGASSMPSPEGPPQLPPPTHMAPAPAAAATAHYTGASGSSSRGDFAAPAAAAAAAGAPPPLEAAAFDRRQQYLVCLPGEDWEEAACLALRYAYTGVLAAGNVRQLIQVRLIGDVVLGLHGIEGACSCMLLSWLLDTPPAALNGRNAALRELLSCRDVHATWRRYVRECRYLQYGDGAPPVAYGGGVPDPDRYSSFEQLCGGRALFDCGQPALAAHFGDAVYTLNSPGLLEDLLRLPAVGLEALLSSDTYGTDSEDSVLALLATWMSAHWPRTDAAVRARLAAQVRLLRMSRTAAACLLISLAADYEARGPDDPAAWFPLTLADASLVVASCTGGGGGSGSAGSWSGSAGLGPEHAAGVPEQAAAYFARRCSSAARPWCRPVPPMPAPHGAAGGGGGGSGSGGGGLGHDGVSFGWSVKGSVLEAALGAVKRGQQSAVVYGRFDGAAGPDGALLARGLAWRLRVQLAWGSSTAGVFIECAVPACYSVGGSRLWGAQLPYPVGLAARLVVLGTSERDDIVLEYASDGYGNTPYYNHYGGAYGGVLGGSSWGDPDLLQLWRGGGVGPEQAWCGHLVGGQLRGRLMLSAP
ncbi:hypothetical protein HYH03_005798 [Edaphochlamys debaryana]|uniref:BACK domain-containing protein n=1 Tax=Edaphochlamys debaryana TaxID=47281 RepID=A0A835Y6T3_9CHLO|nr:hypothetical protein HYH03_005798 [Edaphochlamys debaryana]|eukprot:KAG2496199.1 hypothetical protein HYH03_005798 [Edaphochlamys debaryana]